MVMSFGAGNGATKLPDLNDIQIDSELDPSAKSANTSSRLPIILWLVVLGMVMFFLPIYIFATTVEQDAKNLEADLNTMRVILTTVPTARPDAQRVLTPLAQTQAQIDQLNGVYPTLTAPRPDLPVIMTALNNYNPNELALTALTLENNRMTVNGRAARDEHTIGYVHTLENTNLFARVTLQSAQIALSPTITTTVALTPTPRRTAEPATPVPMPMRFVIILELKAVAP